MSSFFDYDNLFWRMAEKKKETKKNTEKKDSEYHQMSIFDLLSVAADETKEVSTSDIDDMIRALQEKKHALQLEERKKRELEEQKAREEIKRQREEQARQVKLEQERLQAEKKADKVCEGTSIWIS